MKRTDLEIKKTDLQIKEADLVLKRRQLFGPLIDQPQEQNYG